MGYSPYQLVRDFFHQVYFTCQWKSNRQIGRNYENISIRGGFSSQYTFVMLLADFCGSGFRHFQFWKLEGSFDSDTCMAEMSEKRL